MPLVIGFIILASTLIPVYNKIINKKTQNSPRIEKVQNYTMEQIHNSTLSEKYGKYDYPDQTEIEFNNCKYKVIDNKSGGRKFEPKEEKCPPLILTPIPNENLQILSISPLPSISQNYISNKSITNNSLDKNQPEYNQDLNLINQDKDNNKNSNYVRCHFPHSGTLILKKEECDSLIDCQINDSLWTPLTEEECKKRQEGYINQALREYFDKLRNINNQSNYQITPIPSFDLKIPIIPSPSPFLDYSWNSNIKPTLTDEQKIQCKDEIGARYKEKILNMLAKARANGYLGSSYAVQQEKKLLNEMYREIKIQCEIEY